MAARIERLQEEADLPYLQENLPGMVQATRKGLRRVAQIVQNLRGFAQLDRAKIGDVDINESIDLSLEMLDELLSREQICVERDFGTLPPLEAAGVHLNQVFLNLLMNAKQAIEGRGKPSGTIRVTTDCSPARSSSRSPTMVAASRPTCSPRFSTPSSRPSRSATGPAWA